MTNDEIKEVKDVFKILKKPKINNHKKVEMHAQLELFRQDVL